MDTLQLNNYLELQDERNRQGQAIEQAGYWHSELTGIWYQKSKSQPSEFVKGAKVYNWEVVTGEFELGLLNDGLVPEASDYECGYDQQ